MFPNFKNSLCASSALLFFVIFFSNLKANIVIVSKRSILTLPPMTRMSKTKAKLLLTSLVLLVAPWDFMLIFFPSALEIVYFLMKALQQKRDSIKPRSLCVCIFFISYMIQT